MGGRLLGFRQGGGGNWEGQGGGGDGEKRDVEENQEQLPLDRHLLLSQLFTDCHMSG